MKNITLNNLILIAIHICIGFLVTIPIFAKAYGLIIIPLLSFIIIFYGNKNEEALIMAAYIVGAEVFLRMTKSSVLYEMGKYSVVFFLFLGFIKEGSRRTPPISFIFYILLLLLGIIFTKVPEGESLRKAIAFNLSGPIMLGICVLYFYKKTIKVDKIYKALLYMLLPLISMVTYLFFRTPDLSELVFGSSANFSASGGFGPNQVATAIGLGIYILTILIIVKYKVTGYTLLDSVILFYFIYRGFLTFSRGGIFTAAIAIISFVILFVISEKSSKIFFKYILLGGVFLFTTWIYTSNITGGMLNNRYAGKNALGEQKKDITSGRVKILKQEFSFFLNNPLGLGVGNSKYEREKVLVGEAVPTHNEFGRLISEHGIFGFIIIIILLLVPFFCFQSNTYFQNAFLVSFFILWFLTISHSGMRIALPGFIYGLSLTKIINND